MHDGREGGWLGKAIKDARDAISRDSSADHQSTVDTQVGTLEGIISSQDDLWRLGDEIRKAFWDVFDRLPRTERETFARRRIRFDIGEVMKGRVLTKEDFDAARTAWLALMESLRGIQKLVDEVEALEKAGGGADVIKKLYGTIANIDDLTEETRKAIAKEIRGAWPKGLDESISDGPLELLTERWASEDGWIRFAIEALQRAPDDGLMAPKTGQSPLDRIRSAWQNGSRWLVTALDGAYTLIVAVFAIVGALTLNYVGKDSFGSPSEYLTLLIWGFGAPLVGDVLKRAWGRFGMLRTW